MRETNQWKQINQNLCNENTSCRGIASYLTQVNSQSLHTGAEVCNGNDLFLCNFQKGLKIGNKCIFYIFLVINEYLNTGNLLNCRKFYIH